MLGADVEGNLKNYQVTAPEWCVGDVMGKLSRLGGWLDGSEDNNGMVTITARVPEENMSGFQEWLAEVSNGKGEVSENA